MKPGPRSLYIALKRNFTGSNNGAIYLSHRDAAAALSVHRNSAGPMFKELERRGFIRMTVAPHLGPSGIGRASCWALEELPTKDGRPAGKAFMRWTAKQNPRTKSVPARHKKRDGKAVTDAEISPAVTKSVTPSAKKPGGASQE